jgi:hypothetical protein
MMSCEALAQQRVVEDEDRHIAAGKGKAVIIPWRRAG